MRVLTIAPDVPFPPVGGARTRNHHLLRALAAHHDVTVVAFDWGGAVEPPPRGVELVRVPWEMPASDAGADEPVAVAWYASEAMERAVAEACAPGVDVVVMTETATARFRDRVPAGVLRVLDLHDVHARKAAAAGAEPAEVERLRRFESAAAADCALTICVSDTEADAARALLGAQRVEVVPNGVDTTFFTPGLDAGDDDRVVFTGSLHTPSNVEAITWFVREVLPLVRARRPGVVVDVVGAGPTPEVLALDGDGVRVHGPVPDVRDHLRRAAVAVVPIRHGGGTRLKLLEAAATTRAVVTTSVGMEGLDVVPGRDVVLADAPDAFADAVVALCADPARRAALGEAARRAALPYDWAQLGTVYREALERVVREALVAG